MATAREKKPVESPDVSTTLILCRTGELAVMLCTLAISAELELQTDKMTSKLTLFSERIFSSWFKNQVSRRGRFE